MGPQCFFCSGLGTGAGLEQIPLLYPFRLYGYAWLGLLPWDLQDLALSWLSRGTWIRFGPSCSCPLTPHCVTNPGSPSPARQVLTFFCGSASCTVSGGSSLEGGGGIFLLTASTPFPGRPGRGDLNTWLGLGPGNSATPRLGLSPLSASPFPQLSTSAQVAALGCVFLPPWTYIPVSQAGLPSSCTLDLFRPSLPFLVGQPSALASLHAYPLGLVAQDGRQCLALECSRRS